jgi:FkbM family methyltransferase
MVTDTDNITTAEDRSSGLDQTYRDNLDLRLATLAQLKRLNVSPSPVELISRGGEQAISGRVAAPTRQIHIRQLGKRVLKALVRPFLRVAKPYVRPVLGRIRRSMLEQWQIEVRTARSDLRYLVEVNHAQIQELRQAIAETATQERQEIAAQRQEIAALRRELPATTASVRAMASDQAIALSATRDRLSQIMPHLIEIERLASLTVRRAAVYLGDGEALVRTEVGHVLCSTADPALIAAFLETGELERGTRLLIQRFLAPGDCFVDVGANVGMHTIAAARVVGSTGRVIAIEPFAETARLLKKSVAMNELSEAVTFHVTALSNRIGTQTLYLGSTHTHNSLYPLPEVEVAPAAGPPVEVPVTTLDTVLASCCHVELIKIDVEGAELDVLAGAHDTLAKNPEVGLIVEFGPSHIRRTGHNTDEWLAAFQQLGFAYQVINEETGALEQWSVERLEQVESANLFFARLNSPAWAKASAG